MLSKKSFGGNKRNFLKLLMRFVLSEVGIVFRNALRSENVHVGVGGLFVASTAVLALALLR